MKKNITYALGTVCIWATMASMVKMMLSDIPNMQALSISSFFAFLFLLAINLKTKTIKKMKDYTCRQIAMMAGLGLIGIFTESASYYYGLTQLSSQEACILNYLWPIMLVIFSCLFMKEKLTPVKVIAMLCSFAGVIVLCLGGIGTSSGNTTAGIISCIIAAASYGLFSVLNKKAAFNQNITMMIIWLTVAICALIAGQLTETWIMIRGTQWLGILWLGIVIDAVAYLLWALALEDAEESGPIANLAYLTPFLSLIVSAVVLHESIQPEALLALILIIGGILLQNLYPAKNN